MNYEKIQEKEDVISSSTKTEERGKVESTNASNRASVGWSWGGFMFGPAYIIATKQYAYLLLYLLMLVPLVNIVAWIGISIFLGIKGHDLVAYSVMFENNDERRGFVRAIDHAGWIMFLVALVGLVLALLFAGLFIAFFASIFGGPYMFR